MIRMPQWVDTRSVSGQKPESDQLQKELQQFARFAEGVFLVRVLVPGVLAIVALIALVLWPDSLAGPLLTLLAVGVMAYGESDA